MTTDREQVPAESLEITRRPIFNQKTFENDFAIRGNKKSKTCCFRFSNGIKSFVKTYNPLNVYKLFGILNMFSEYNIKANLGGDIVSGITMGIMGIPAGLAYGALTSLNPVNGLYTNLLPSLVYILFCTSRHMSVGAFAIIAIMVYSTITKIEGKYIDQLGTLVDSDSVLRNETATNLIFPDDPRILDIKTRIATTLAFWCGVIQVGLSVIRFGTLSKFFSRPLLRGFTTAAAIHVFTTQMRHIFGIYGIGSKHQFFKIIYTYVGIFSHITHTNWLSLVISVVSIFLLLIFKLKLNEKLKKPLRNIPVPVELFIIVISTMLVYFGKWHEKYNLAIVGNIPTGLPLASMPDFSLTLELLPDAIVMSLIAFATSISIADLYARKHKYSIDSNKELFALGAANIAGAFFKCFTAAGALARSAVQDSSGGKTQVVTIISNVFLLIVILFLSPLLETLPKACLGSIIVAALVRLLQQVTDIPYYWRLDKLDFATWMLTFMASVILDIDFGLWIGLISVLFFNTFRNQK